MWQDDGGVSGLLVLLFLASCSGTVYESKELGIALEIPDGWVVESDPHGLILRKEEGFGHIAVFAMHEMPLNQSLEMIWQQDFEYTQEYNDNAVVEIVVQPVVRSPVTNRRLLAGSYDVWSDEPGYVPKITLSRMPSQEIQDLLKRQEEESQWRALTRWQVGLVEQERVFIRVVARLPAADEFARGELAQIDNAFQQVLRSLEIVDPDLADAFLVAPSSIEVSALPPDSLLNEK